MKGIGVNPVIVSPVSLICPLLPPLLPPSSLTFLHQAKSHTGPLQHLQGRLNPTDAWQMDPGWLGGAHGWVIGLLPLRHHGASVPHQTPSEELGLQREEGNTPRPSEVTFHRGGKCGTESWCYNDAHSYAGTE